MISNRVGNGFGPLYGTMVHTMFGRAVKAQNLPGVGRDGVEQSFSLGSVKAYGTDGTIRTDFVLRDLSDPKGPPIAIWDVKTGRARLSASRVQNLRDQVGVDETVPVIELHVQRGVRIKCYEWISEFKSSRQGNLDRFSAYSALDIPP